MCAADTSGTTRALAGAWGAPAGTAAVAGVAGAILKR
jgi:hypothetical protein